MATNDVLIHVSIDDDASKPLKHVKDRTDDLSDSVGKADASTKTLNGSMSNLSNIVGGFIVAQGLTKLGGFLVDAAKGAAEDEAANIRLTTALGNYSMAALKATGDTSDYASMLSELTGDMQERIAAGQKLAFTDDDIRNSMGALLVATDDYSEATKRQAVAMDLARGRNISLAEASKLLGKLNAENVDIFKKMGVEIADGATEAEALATIQAKFAGQTEAYAKSSAGQFAVAQIQMSEMKESIGAAVLPMFVRLGAVVVEEVFPRIEKAVNAVAPILEMIAQWITEKVFPVLEMLGEVVREKFELFMVYYEESIKPALENIEAGFSKIVEFVTDHWPEIWTVIGPMVAQIKNEFQTVFAVITGLIDAVIKLIGGDFSGAWRALGNVVEAVFDGVKNTVKNSLNVLISLVNVMLDAISAIEIDVPSIPLPFGRSVPGFSIGMPNLPNIPHLAQGGIVKARPGGTLAILGESGNSEAVVPLQGNTLASGLSGTTINVTVSGIVLDPIGTGRAIADALNQASLSTGALVLSGAVQQ